MKSVATVRVYTCAALASVLACAAGPGWTQPGVVPGSGAAAARTPPGAAAPTPAQAATRAFGGAFGVPYPFPAKRPTGGIFGPGGPRPEAVIKGPPAGVQPLAVDLFTSKNFYKDKASWSDPRYFRCNSSRQMAEAMWEQGRIGKNPPTSASWGDSCKDAFPREKIVSPYPYKTA
ncbi:MAG: hypothetical protein ACXU8W_16220, partial [Caulobacteraceae bacterium]